MPVLHQPAHFTPPHTPEAVHCCPWRSANEPFCTSHAAASHAARHTACARLAWPDAHPTAQAGKLRYRHRQHQAPAAGSTCCTSRSSSATEWRQASAAGQYRQHQVCWHPMGAVCLSWQCSQLHSRTQWQAVQPAAVPGCQPIKATSASSAAQSSQHACTRLHPEHGTCASTQHILHASSGAPQLTRCMLACRAVVCCLACR